MVRNHRKGAHQPDTEIMCFITQRTQNTLVTWHPDPGTVWSGPINNYHPVDVCISSMVGMHKWERLGPNGKANPTDKASWISSPICPDCGNNEEPGQYRSSGDNSEQRTVHGDTFQYNLCPTPHSFVLPTKKKIATSFLKCFTKTSTTSSIKLKKSGHGALPSITNHRKD